jgi:transketolase
LVDLFNTLHTQRRGKPNAIILNTIKGKGIQMCQYNPNWHTSAPRTVEAARQWLLELWERDGRRLGIPQAFHEALGRAIQVVPPLYENPDRIIEKQA